MHPHTLTDLSLHQHLYPNHFEKISPDCDICLCKTWWITQIWHTHLARNVPKFTRICTYIALRFQKFPRTRDDTFWLVFGGPSLALLIVWPIYNLFSLYIRWYSLCNSVCNFSEPVPDHVSWCMDKCNLYHCFCRVAIGALMAESRSAFEIFLAAFNAENQWYYHYVLRCSVSPESPQTMG